MSHMRRIALLAALLVALPPYRLTAQVAPTQLAKVAWLHNPRAANATWVSDASHHLRPATVDSLNAIISTLERETGTEIAVAVVDSLSGLTEQEFALAIHRGWGVGKADRDNGLVLLWAPNDRAVFISVGNGLEGVIPDRRAGRIRDQQIFAAFREQRFDDGLLAGVRALAAAAREETNPVQRAPRGVSPLRSRGEAPGGGTGSYILTFGVLGFCALSMGGAFVLRIWQRRRPRNCSKGHPMRRLDDKEEIARLDEGDQFEQTLKSIDWDVWACDSCGETQRIPYPHGAWDECPKCKLRAMKAKRQVIDQPTPLSTGLARITRICRYCHHKYSVDEVIPRVVVSSGGSSGGSSSGGGGGSSGGGSFGGGSAGGGGAGGRY